ncbi:DMT family transporter [Devosia sp. XJ19-1]|uniref:DMT family transporter n=1 Tax=Devosia ureilytica TaxID=2952754 RepID=A0A9Q4AKD4_9HYPH|nr:DMT family transporter [Devosia ureilytica]MCP8882515.1 DMT family transporter [Devosia ureilytica]MCP8885598.1 DMT family transporter [Devosia ureilytica]
MPLPAAPPPALTHQPLRGLVLILGATLLFAYNDTTNKLLITEYNVPMVAAIRYICHCLLMLAIVAPLHGREMVRTQRTGLVLVRAASLALGSFMVSLALQRMPVAETTAIVYLCPVLVVLLSGPLLKEKVGPAAWIAALIGFTGVLLIARPGGGLDPLGVVFVLGNVVVATAYNLLSRVLAHTERTMAMLFYSALVGAIGFGIFLPWTLYGAAPTPLQIVLFIGLGVSAWLGHYLFTQSYRYAPAALVAPMTYMHLVWAGVLGWLVFGHAPEPIALAGMALVAIAGLVSAVRPRRGQRPAQLAAEAGTTERAG